MTLTSSTRVFAALLALVATGAALGVAACSSDTSQVAQDADAQGDSSASNRPMNDAGQGESSTDPTKSDGSVVTDAGPRDAAFVTDSGFVQTPALPGVQCRRFGGDAGTTQFTCSAPQVCCENVFNTPSACVSATDSATTCLSRVACDGPEDCPVGQSCRLGFPNFFCATGQQEGDACHTKADCGSGFVCCQPKGKLGDGGFAPPPAPGSNLLYLVNGGCTAPGSTEHWCDG